MTILHPAIQKTRRQETAIQHALSHYRKTSEARISGRETECAAFNMINRELAACNEGQARVRALGRNHAMWSTLVRDLGLSENLMPDHVKTQLIGLGLWSMGYSIRALLEPLSVQPLIDVNHNIVEGLALQEARGSVGRNMTTPLSV